MLRTLRIRNFAIVESLVIEPGPGLSVFTGETGAGKTILVEAIRFLLGGRAGVEMIRTGSDVAVVEGYFDPPAALPDAVGPDLAAKEPFWLRRELSAQGTTRAFANDRLINRAALQALGERLADLCGQHQHQVLLDSTRHVEWLDRFGGSVDLAAQFRRICADLTAAVRRQAELSAQVEQRRAQDDLRQFQIAEIRAAEVRPDEEDALRGEAVILKNARRLTEAAESALASLSENDGAVDAVLGRLRREIAALEPIDPRWAPIAALLADAHDATTDAARTLAAYRDNLSFDPQRQDQIEARLAELYRLKSKYGGSGAAILEHLSRLESEHQADRRLDEELLKLSAQRLALEHQVVDLAGELSKRRHQAASALESAVNTAITKLGMSGAHLLTEFSPYTEGGLVVAGQGGTINVHDDGRESIRFLFEANPREGCKPLDKIASGGELSRLLLAFKSVTANGTDSILYVFDEIDAGIGGQTAHTVAKQIRVLARHSQVFLITHLQQLAAVANDHYRITKKTARGRARVVVERLEGDERVQELARMVAGDDVTDSTLEFAAELARPRKR